MKKLLITALAISLMAACKKDKDDPRDPVPVIEVLKIGPSIVTEFKDSVVILIRYQDGDGDLGGVPADEANLFVIDNRINVPFEFRVQELVPGGEKVPITGELEVVLQNLYLTNNATQQKVDFDIYVNDRAGHKSNRVTTQAILLKEE